MMADKKMYKDGVLTKEEFEALARAGAKLSDAKFYKLYKWAVVTKLRNARLRFIADGSFEEVQVENDGEPLPTRLKKDAR